MTSPVVCGVLHSRSHEVSSIGQSGGPFVTAWRGPSYRCAVARQLDLEHADERIRIYARACIQGWIRRETLSSGPSWLADDGRPTREASAAVCDTGRAG